MVAYAPIDDSAERGRLFRVDLTGAMAIMARLRRSARFGPRAVTCLTCFLLRNRNFRFFAKDRFFKFQRHRILNIGALARRIRIFSSAAAKEHIKYVTETSEIFSTKSAESTGSCLRSGVAEAVVLRAFFIVA